MFRSFLCRYIHLITVLRNQQYAWVHKDKAIIDMR